MTPVDDPLVRQLAALSVESPDAIKSARTRMRCHAALARQHAKAGGQNAVTVRWWLVESTRVAAASLAYLSDLVRRALALH